LQNVSSITRTQHIKKATRSEPSLKTSEFHLSKTSNATFDDQQPSHDNTGQVTVKDLLKIFKKTNKHTELGKTLLKTQRVKKRLEKPLEKIHAEKIQRAVGYEKTKTQLNRWDAIVAKNAMAEQLVFPLQDTGDGLEIKTPKTLENFRVKSDLMLQMEALMPEKEPAEDEPSEFALSVDEIKEKAKELAKIRMRESYKMAKGRRQNKIKSKKFHRLLKRDKVKQQLKDFELLQKSDPDAALKKLEQIEHQRALERTSLRHKNTGSWAQNLQVSFHSICKMQLKTRTIPFSGSRKVR
jgi:U3 small nucleolar RNA-associated protein 14